MHKIAGTIVDEPIVMNRADRPIVADTKMLAAKVHTRIGEHVAVGRIDRTARDRRVGRPGAVRILFALPANAALRVRRVRVILLEARRAVMVVVVGIGDVGAVTVFDLDLEAVALMPGVIHRVEIVDAAVGDAGL